MAESMMPKITIALGCLFTLVSTAVLAQDKATVLLVVGAAGEEQFGKAFSQWAESWEKAGAQAGAKMVVIGTSNSEATPDRELLQQALADEPREGGELWLVLIGHGTF